LYSPHPTMDIEEIRVGTQHAWDSFYSWRRVWERAKVVKSLKARVAFVLISKLYRQMYANTGIATDSARVARSARYAVDGIGGAPVVHHDADAGSDDAGASLRRTRRVSAIRASQTPPESPSRHQGSRIHRGRRPFSRMRFRRHAGPRSAGDGEHRQRQDGGVSAADSSSSD
jgi:hypothetical protein